MQDFEEAIERLKFLRELYRTLCSFHSGLHTDYQGDVLRRGDAVSMYPTGDLLVVDKVLPRGPGNISLRHLLNVIDWEEEGYLVVTYVLGDGFIYGYKKVADYGPRV